MVTSLRTDNVESVMVKGNWIMQNKTILTVNEAEIIEEAKKRAAEVVQRAGIKLPERFKVVA